MKVHELIAALSVLDPDAEVARRDGVDPYWGPLYCRVENIAIEQQVPLNGYKRPGVDNVVVIN